MGFVNINIEKEPAQVDDFKRISGYLEEFRNKEQWVILRAEEYWKNAFALHFRKGATLIKVYSTINGTLLECYTEKNGELVFENILNDNGSRGNVVVEILYKERKDEVSNRKNGGDNE